MTVIAAPKNHQAVIGITSTWSPERNQHELWDAYTAAVSMAGGIPIILPATSSYSSYDAYLDIIDGLILSGGQDIMPLSYGQEPQTGFELTWQMEPTRDNFELELCSRALERNLPILGICRGEQLLAVANGGTLWQDTAFTPARGGGSAQDSSGSQRPATASTGGSAQGSGSQGSGSALHGDSDGGGSAPHGGTGKIRHYQIAPWSLPSHYIEVDDGSLLSSIVGQKSIAVNSLHHQAIRAVPEGLVVSAHAADGTIEAIESPGHRFVLGVQWHPERMSPSDSASCAIFKAFVSACACATE
jgi:putative glutamine amidotransferase